MNDASSAAKDQIAEKLRAASNVLVAVSQDPTIDQLSAAIATTLLLNKFKKNATAVFSGRVPDAIEFLKPQENIQKSTDSLRDFVISLDKEKADKLRYKVEDDVVKIFITPYKTSLSPKDLKYSAGDFNVDLILALGVKHRQDLDKAITAHGRIFHDAVVLGINNSSGGDIGDLNWEDLEASSLSELVAELVPSLDDSLFDAMIATALLTGIVSETSRFSNKKTHPRTLAVSSRLLEAGANQQLVNAQLQDVIGRVEPPPAGMEIQPAVSEPKISESEKAQLQELKLDELDKLKQPEADKDEPAGPADAAVPEAEPVSESPLPETNIPEPPESAPAPAAPAAPADGPEELDLSTLTGYPHPEQPAPAPPAATVPPAAEAFAAPAAGPPPQGAAAPPPPPLEHGEDLVFTSPEDLAKLTAEPAPPPQPVQEPAPLSMSPADQTSTMPMPPPADFAPQQPPPFGPPPMGQPAPGPGVPPAAPGAPAQSAPPVPPPIIGHNFGR